MQQSQGGLEDLNLPRRRGQNVDGTEHSLGRSPGRTKRIALGY